MVLSGQIKLHTRLQHQELEGLLIPQIKSIRSEEDYGFLLKLFYGYFAPLEQYIAGLKDSRLPDFDQRRKAETILKDLDFIKQNRDFPTLEFAIPEIQDFPQALGALYVMEGSTLGGKFIAAMIGRQLNWNSEFGLSFFIGYGEATEKMWKGFLHIIDDPNLSVLEKEAVIFSAKITFIHFSALVKQRYRI